MSRKLGPEVYKALRGVFCIYKPSGMSMSALNEAFSLMLSNEIGKLPLNTTHAEVIDRSNNTAQQLAEKYREMISTPRTQPTSDLSVKASPSASMPDLVQQRDADLQVTQVAQELSPLKMAASDVQYHPKVLGNLWRAEDFHILTADILPSLASGVLPVCIGKREYKRDLEIIRQSNPIKVYRVSVRLGISTDNFMLSGRVLERSTLRHVNQATLDKVLSGIQASHQKEQFKLMGVDMASQDAYELASRGLVRPPYDRHAKQAVIFGIKPVDYEHPNLTLEIHTVNERGSHLLELVHKMGVDLRCGAVCTKIRRIRFGHFDLSHCLVRQQWNYSNIIRNFEQCKSAVTVSIGDRMAQLSQTEKYESRIISSRRADR